MAVFPHTPASGDCFFFLTISKVEILFNFTATEINRLSLISILKVLFSVIFSELQFFVFQNLALL